MTLETAYETPLVVLQGGILEIVFTSNLNLKTDNYANEFTTPDDISLNIPQNDPTGNWYNKEDKDNFTPPPGVERDANWEFQWWSGGTSDPRKAYGMRIREVSDKDK